MSYKTLFAAASLAVLASTGFAADQTPQPLSRDDVVAELQRARASGETSYFSECFGYTMQAPQPQATAFIKTAAQPAAPASPMSPISTTPINAAK